jgi:hypothetical protein
MTKVAMCRDCNEPLVSTFSFSHKEFICVKCGRLFEWLEPMATERTDELDARLAELEAEWRPIGDALLSGGVMLSDCATCTRMREPHLTHATDEERAAHEAALEHVKQLQSRRNG